MNQIESALGSEFRMFFHPGLSIEILIPGQTLKGCIHLVNQSKFQHGDNWTQWSWESRNEAARLVWVNWIYQRLNIDPIRKPLLLDRRQEQLHVLCGDTRLMSLGLLSNPPLVSAVITCKHHQQHLYQDWTRITTDRQLIELLNFDPASTQIFFTAADPEKDHAISWLEIGDASTAHYLHNEEHRWQAFCHWIQQHPNVEFSMDWARSTISWSEYGL